MKQRGTLTDNHRSQTITYTAETKEKVLERFTKIIKELKLDVVTIKLRTINELT